MTLTHDQIERLAARVDPDGTLVREAVERALADRPTGEEYAREALAALGIVEDEYEARMFASMSEADREYLPYLRALGLDVQECVTVEVCGGWYGDGA